MDSSTPTATTLSRRGLGLGALALAAMRSGPAAASTSPGKGPTARRVIFLCMAGGPSHVDTFDPKPALRRDEGKTVGAGRRRGRLMASPWKHTGHGESGIEISELFPGVASQADKLCLLRGMTARVPAHPQAFLELHTGTSQFVRPSVGAWTVYGLGTENQNLPGFISLAPPTGNGGGQNYGGGFLPPGSGGTPIRGRGFGGDAGSIANIAGPHDAARRRRRLDLIGDLGRISGAGDGSTDAVIAAHELAFRMQGEAAEVLDAAAEPAAVREAYGLNDSATRKFGTQCLMARRLVESGVRFVELHHGGWDQHNNLRENLAKNAAAVDGPIAALLRDLDGRGLLDETLVLWGGEFGRTPFVQGSDGRDHNHRGFTMWMAGGGVRGGHVHGATDQHGTEAVEGVMDVHDLHATILAALGLDHESLTFNYAGRDFRLTDVHGNVADVFG